ncbi:MAG TPA: hypothetical protein VHV82_08340 [Sporichthyaceae bacterium]|jgi:Flp pilus assembly protein TadB|nr:hypothetical protein [Sporichthyaceae bacterium]
MTAAVLVFGGLGAALLGLLILLVRPGPTLLAAIGRLDAARTPTRSPTSTSARTWAARQVRLGRWVEERLARRTPVGRVTNDGRAADLAITAGSNELLIGRQVFVGLTGFLMLPLLVIALAAVGWRLPAVVLVLGSPALGVCSAWLPQVELRREAEARRREFRQHLSSYLDLVAMSLAGGRGAAQALAETAAMSEAWSFRLLGDVLATARLTGTNHWHGLGELGEGIGIGELGDLAASLALVGDHGARVRETLAARAAGLRRRALTDAEGNAAAADQAMRIAQVLLALGFLVLIAYPAVAAVLTM